MEVLVRRNSSMRGRHHKAVERAEIRYRARNFSDALRRIVEEWEAHIEPGLEAEKPIAELLAERAAELVG